MNQKKRRMLVAVLLAVLLSLTLFGCGAEKNGDIKMNIDYGKRADGSTYTVYNGDAQEFFGVAEGRENVVDITVNQEAGALYLTIHEENEPDHVIYEGHVFPAGHFTVTVKDAGRYRILVHAENFIGSYEFRYDMNQ